MASQRAAARFLVSGSVQGVCFLASTRERALALGIDGYARNLPDGRVEVLALGAPDSIDALERWLQHGPARAVVERVLRETAGDDGRNGFSTG